MTRKRYQQQPASEKEPEKNPIKLKLGPLEIEGRLELVLSLLVGLVVGIGLALFVIVQYQQPSVLIEPMISRALTATIAARPLTTFTSTPTPSPTSTSTSTPSPTPTPTPTSMPTQTPTPQARISEPADGESVPPNAKVVVEYKNIAQDHYLWVVVRIPSIHPKTWWIYPQLYENKVPSHWVGSGMLTTNAALGGPRDTGAPFNIVVLLVGEEANRSFVEYANHCGPVPTTCTGMPLPETEIEILDFTTVIRK